MAIRKIVKVGDPILRKTSRPVEALCLLDERFRGTGVATTDCKLIIFTAEEFKELMKKSPKAASKALSKLAEI